MNQSNDFNLDRFDRITLDEMKGIKLMNRTDTKYVTTREGLIRWLELAREEYFAQEIMGEKLMPYHTIYYDTPDLSMYHAHHNQRKHRQKVRVREYECDHQMFLEVKDKNNHGRTKKKRISIPSLAISNMEQTAWVDSLLMFDATSLAPKIENHFNRITLVNHDKTERLTIDLDLRFDNLISGESVFLPNHAVIELKRDGNYASPALGLLQQMRIKPCGFSKYALGMAMTDKNLKQNNFKVRLRYLEKLAR